MREARWKKFNLAKQKRTGLQQSPFDMDVVSFKKKGIPCFSFTLQDQYVELSESN